MYDFYKGEFRELKDASNGIIIVRRGGTGGESLREASGAPGGLFWSHFWPPFGSIWANLPKVMNERYRNVKKLGSILAERGEDWQKKSSLY